MVKTKWPTKTRAFAFTSYNLETFYEGIVNGGQMEYIAYSEEVCPTTKRNHHQGFCYFTNPKSTSTKSLTTPRTIWHHRIHAFTRKNEYFTLSDGNKIRGDPGEYVLLLRRYFQRTVEDLQGLTFKQEQANKGEVLAVNSSELRAVQGHQKNDFVLRLINPPKLRQKIARSGKKDDQAANVEYGPKQEWGLDPDIDYDTRKVCEST